MRMITNIKSKVMQLYYDYLQWKLNRSYNRHLGLQTKIEDIEVTYMGVVKNKVDWDKIEADFGVFEQGSYKATKPIEIKIEDYAEDEETHTEGQI